jgi:hypothetical protein
VRVSCPLHVKPTDTELRPSNYMSSTNSLSRAARQLARQSYSRSVTVSCQLTDPRARQLEQLRSRAVLPMVAVRVDLIFPGKSLRALGSSLAVRTGMKRGGGNWSDAILLYRYVSSFVIKPSSAYNVKNALLLIACQPSKTGSRKGGIKTLVCLASSKLVGNSIQVTLFSFRSPFTIPAWLRDKGGKKGRKEAKTNRRTNRSSSYSVLEPFR